MSVSLGLVLLGGLLLIFGIFRTRKSLRNSSSVRLTKSILVVGAAFWIVAGGHALLVNASSTNTSSIAQLQRGIPKAAAQKQSDLSLLKQKDSMVDLRGKIVGIKNGQHNVPTYLLIARNGNENKLVAVRVDNQTRLGRGVALNHDVTVRGMANGVSAKNGYRHVPVVAAERIVKNDFSNKAA